MNDAPRHSGGSVSMFARSTGLADPVEPDVHEGRAAPAKRPPAWSLRNWRVRWKVVAIVAVPLMLAILFGGLRSYGAMTAARGLRLAADRVEMVPAITKYMSALDVALLASSTDGDVEGAKKNFEARKSELTVRAASTSVAGDVRSGVNALLSGGQALLDKVASNDIGLRDRVTAYAPILLTAENAIDGSVRVDDQRIRAAARGLGRAIGARGQMMMQQLLITRGADLPEPELRTSMVTLAGTEPSTLFGMSEVLGVGSPEAKSLQQQMVSRMAIISNPASVLIDNPELLRSIQTTDAIAAKLIKDAAASLTKSVEDQAADRHDAAFREIVVVLAAIVTALVIVLLVARSLIGPLRVLRDRALKVAHEDLEHEIVRVRTGDERPPEPLPVYTTEEIGQVAHAVDELHTQALLLAGDEARLRRLVNDMFETMSRRNRSLVDQQLALIDQLERDEENPARLDSLFRLDHLAARMRRNGANLLVLAGAKASLGEQRGPVPLSTVVDAATSEVEDYRRVKTAAVPDRTIVGGVVGDIAHLLAELIDNALRYAPPASPVEVSAVLRNDGGIHLTVVDTGLGMTDGDRRMANVRLRAGGEVTPDNARHMGLFVVARLAARHGMRVRLRGSSSDETSGTTAEVYLPPTVLVGAAGGYAAPTAWEDAAVPAAFMQDTVADYGGSGERSGGLSDELSVVPAERNGSGPAESPVTELPRRNPGTSGITGGSDQPDHRARHEPPPPWRDDEPTPARLVRPPVADTSSFFASRAQVGAAVPQPDAAETDDGRSADAAGSSDASEDLIYQRMLSEWLVDPHELGRSTDLDWKSVWDRGWSAAAEVENVPVAARTDQGLPVREPGARLVPGGAMPEQNGNARHRAGQQEKVASNGGSRPGSAEQALTRDPEAIRASISSHFGGVRAGRAHAKETDQGHDQQ
jgi:signal transduction histidine kinase